MLATGRYVFDGLSRKRAKHPYWHGNAAIDTGIVPQLSVIIRSKCVDRTGIRTIWCELALHCTPMATASLLVLFCHTRTSRGNDSLITFRKEHEQYHTPRLSKGQFYGNVQRLLQYLDEADNKQFPSPMVRSEYLLEREEFLQEISQLSQYGEIVQLANSLREYSHRKQLKHYDQLCLEKSQDLDQPDYPDW